MHDDNDDDEEEGGWEEKDSLQHSKQLQTAF